MRTLTLLTALLLLALQAQARPPTPRPADAPDEEQLGKKGQVTTIFFTKEVSSVLQDAGVRRFPRCVCKRVCHFGEHITGFCHTNYDTYTFCCY